MFRSRKRSQITFEVLPLWEAVHQLNQNPKFVNSDRILIENESREWVLQAIISHLPKNCINKFTFDEMLMVVTKYRKLGEECRAKRLIILEHARGMVTPRCFYAGKVSSPCTNEVDLDRIKPGKRGGKYTIDNTQLSCSGHNRARGCKEVVKYWSQ